MTHEWPTVPLAEVIEPSRDEHPVLADSSYPNVGIYSFGRGIFEKPLIEGATTSARTLFRIRAKQFIYSRLFAFEGAYGLVPEEHDGAFVSNEFPSFNVDQERLSPGFLELCFKLPSTWKALSARTVGMGDRRQRIKPDQLLSYQIPLPPLAEQQRIVAKFERLAAKIDQARGLQRAISTEATALCRAIVSPERCDNVETVRVGELVILQEPDVDVQADQEYDFAGVYSFGRGVFRGETRPGLECSYKKLTRLRANDFIYPKLMAWEGAFGIVPEDCAGLVVSTEFPVFEIDTSRVLPEFLDVYFSDPRVWPTLPSKGTNVRRRRLHPEDFADYELSLPDLNSQYRLRAAKAKVDRLKALQAQTRAELDALLPSILDRAFNGEL